MKTYTENRKNKSLGRFMLVCALLFVAVFTVHAQNVRTLVGKVLNEDGEAIQGAIINVSESSRIALSDADGKFSLKGVRADDELYVSALGYKNANVPVNFDSPKDGSGDAFFTIRLKEVVDDHQFTVPVPFMRKQDRFVTESMSAVTGEELQKHPITVLQNALTSTVTGVATYEAASEPGWAETTTYIRGVRTMNSSARAPLIMVDDVERDLSFLDAFPIEKITILKDAAATAIYGMRGANGVIMVTTKRGEPGRTKIKFTQEVGVQMLSNTKRTQNAYNKALTQNQVRYLSGSDPMYTAEQIEKYRIVSEGGTLEGMDQYRYFDTNWFAELYRDMSPMYRTNLTLSGGSERTRYFVEFTYLRHEGMWNRKWTDYNPNFSTQHVLDRWNLRSNLDIKVNKFLDLSLDLGGRIDNIRQPNNSVFNLVTFGAVECDPMAPVYTPGGQVFSSNSVQNAGKLLASSGIGRNRRRNVYSTVTVTGNLDDLLAGLKAKAVVSFDSYETFQSNQGNNVNSYSYNLWEDVDSPDKFTMTQSSVYSALGNPSATQREYYYNVNTRFGLAYDHAFGKHAINAQAFVRTYQHLETGSNSTNRFLSYNGQLNYIFDSKYILSGSISYMGNDNYAPGQQFGLFPGGSIGWVASEESWLKNKNINLLKLRASYGRAGQSNTGAPRYPYQGTFTSGNGYNFGTSQASISGVYESRAGNFNSKWEISDMVNIGLDFDFWSRKLYGSVDAFKEWRSNILVTRATVPSLFGITAPSDSYGKVESRGFEVTLGHENKVGDFTYHVEGMLSLNRNKITEMDELPPNVPWQAKTGNPIFEYTHVAAMYESEARNVIGGWNQYQFVQWASDPSKVPTSHQDAINNPWKYPYNVASGTGQPLGTAVFKDLDGDRKIDSNDMTPLGFTIIPQLIPSLNIGFEWKGIDARTVLTAYLNRSMFLSPMISFSGWSNMATDEITHAWGYYTDDPNDPRNVNAKYPRPTWGSYDAIDSDRGTSTYMNDIWILNGNYLSLRNIEVGYTLPIQWTSKLNMTKVRLYFSGYNLTTWSHAPKGTDPERPMGFCWWYPKTRSFTFGLNVEF